MKTIIRISKDNIGTTSYDLFCEEISYLVNEEVEVLCKVKNNSLNNIVEEKKNYFTTDTKFKYKTEVEAKGYSQGDWQTYILYHNVEKDDENLQRLVRELQKSFTHMNNYYVEKFERVEIDGKNFDADPHDMTWFAIRDVEFPDKDDVLAAYLEIYGKDYDEIIIDLNN